MILNNGNERKHRKICYSIYTYFMMNSSFLKENYKVDFDNETF